MKRKIMFIALYSAVFMFPSIGIVGTADAETDISHCANLEATAARPACEAAAHSMGAPAPFDDGLMGAAGMPGTGAPYMGAPGMGAPGAAGMPGTGAPHMGAPGMGAPGAAGMPGTGAPYMGAPGAAGMPSGYAVPPTGGNTGVPLCYGVPCTSENSGGVNYGNSMQSGSSMQGGNSMSSGNSQDYQGSTGDGTHDCKNDYVHEKCY
jgi:hypothetical protein